MVDTDGASPAVQLLTIVWRNMGSKTRSSWRRVNQYMSNALHLAIGAGLEFAEGDFDVIYKKFRANYWWGASSNGGHGEGFYSLAVATDNLSAAHAFEKFRERKPFIADFVSASPWRAHYPFDRKRSRLAIGFSFEHDGHRLSVTSFARDGSHLVACAYNRDGKAIKRYKLTHVDFRERHKRIMDGGLSECN